ncbi:MAG TPA: O-antigen ligase family protein [bacterium]|nr:O-antigen ligase family protein [bacterium]
MKDDLRGGRIKRRKKPARSLSMLAGQNILLLMLLAVPLAFTPLTLDRYSQIKWAILQLLVPFLLAAALVFRRTIREVFFTGPMMVPALVFVACGFVSVLFAQNRPWAARSAVNLLYMLALMLACKTLVQTGLDLRKVLVAIIIASTLVALLGIIQYYGLFGQRRIPDSYGELQTPSTIGHNNFAAAFIIMAIPATLAVLASASRAWVTVAYSVSLSVQLYYLIITASRGAWTGCFVGSFFWAVWAFVLPALSRSKGPRRSRKAIVVVLPLVCAVVALIIASPSTRSLVIDKAASMINFNDKPIQFRLLTWRSTISMIAERPLGVGLANYEMRYPEYRSPEEHRITGRFKKVQHAHNEYLQTTAELGVYGTVAFLFLIVSFFRAGASAARNAQARRDKLMLQAVLVGQLAMLVHSIFSFPAHLPVTLMMFWVYCGLVAAPIRLETGAAIASKNPHRRSAPALLIAALVLAILQLSASELISEYHQSRGILLKNKAEYEQAAAQFQKAAEFCNSNFLNHYLASVCLRNMGKLDDAIDESLKSLKYNPNDRHSIFNLGALYSYKGRTDEAIGLWKRVLSLDPDYAQAYFNMGAVYEHLGKPALALSAYKNALGIAPGMKGACHNLVVMLERMARFSEARDALVHCLENVQDLQLQLDLARVYTTLGETGNAQRTLIDARRLFGEDERIEALLRSLENEH